MSNEVKAQTKGALSAALPHADSHGIGVAGGCTGGPKHLELRLLINSHCPIISVESSEEDRFVALLRCVAADISVPLYLWSVTEGLSRVGAAALYNSDQPELALPPVVLWIDEIEKAFASAGTSGDADAGLSQRLLATLLTWMQDRESGVFLAATSNNITVLPPEMMRKGRFDEIFFVDLPGEGVREALFTLHLKKRGRDATGLDVAKLAGAAKDFRARRLSRRLRRGCTPRLIRSSSYRRMCCWERFSRRGR